MKHLLEFESYSPVNEFEVKGTSITDSPLLASYPTMCALAANDEFEITLMLNDEAIEISRSLWTENPANDALMTREEAE